MRPVGKQQGSTLLVSLIMLVLLTLIAVSAIQSTTSSLQVVGNAQFREEATAAAQDAIEEVVSNTSFMSSPPATKNVDINNDGTPEYTVRFTPAPSCSVFKPVDTTQTGLPVECYGSIGSLCYWTTWDVTAAVTDTTTGANISVHQGVRTIAGLNTALASCGV